MAVRASLSLSLSLPPSLVRLFVGAPGDLQVRLFSLPKICSGFEIECSQHFDLIYFLERRFLWGSAAVAPTSFVGASKSFESFQQLKPAYNVIWKERLKKAKH